MLFKCATWSSRHAIRGYVRALHPVSFASVSFRQSRRSLSTLCSITMEDRGEGGCSKICVNSYERTQNAQAVLKLPKASQACPSYFLREGESPVWICTPFKPICGYLHLLTPISGVFPEKKIVYFYGPLLSALWSPTRINPNQPAHAKKQTKNRPNPAKNISTAFIYL